MQVAYDSAVSEPKVDRAAWAREVNSLILLEAGGNKARFARLVGGTISTRTVDRWLDESVNVSADSVRAVCISFGLPVAPMLQKVGYLAAGETTAPGADRVDELAADLAAIQTIQEAKDIPPSLRRQLLAHLREQANEHAKQRLAEVERMIDLARRTQGRAS